MDFYIYDISVLWITIGFAGLLIVDYYRNKSMGLKTLCISPSFPIRPTHFICITCSGAKTDEDLNKMQSG